MVKASELTERQVYDMLLVKDRSSIKQSQPCSNTSIMKGCDDLDCPDNNMCSECILYRDNIIKIIDKFSNSIQRIGCVRV